METIEEEAVKVWLLAETDDWDDVARLGMAHSQYTTCEVVLVPEPNGWWDAEYTPYAVFAHQQDLTHVQARQHVAEALANDTVRYDDVPTQECDTVSGSVDVSIDVRDLGSAVHAGMNYGKQFNKVRVMEVSDGTPVLRFGSDESESTDDDDEAELTRLLNRI